MSVLTDVLRAEVAGEDLQETEDNIVVCAMRADGTLYELGSVSAIAAMQNPNGARAAISRIKFARDRDGRLTNA